MCSRYKEKQDKELIEEAKKLGVFVEDELYENGKFREGATQLRVRNAKMAINANRMWIIALVATIVSVVSALAAWTAVLWRR